MDKSHVIKDLETAGSVDLVMAAMVRDRLRADHVPINKEVAEDLKVLAISLIERAKAMDWKVYEPDLRIDNGTELIFIPASLITGYEKKEDPAVSAQAVRRLIDIDNDVVRGLQEAVLTDSISARDVDALRHNMYALLIGDNPDDRTIYLRSVNPRPPKLAKPGWVITAFADTLVKFDKPVLAFDSSFDVVISKHGLLVFSQKVFEKVFRGVHILDIHHSERVAALSAAFPMDETSLQVVESMSRQPRIQSKLRALAENGHLEKTNLTKVIAHAKSIGLDLDDLKLLRDDKLNVTKENFMPILQLANEEMWEGPFSKRVYVAGSKSMFRGGGK